MFNKLKINLVLSLCFLISSITSAEAQIATEWKRCIGGYANEIALDVHITADGGYLLGGFTGSNNGDVTVNHGNYDYWVVKLGIHGDLQWEKTYGGTLDDIGGSMSLTADGGFIIAGNSESNNGDVTGNHGGFDCWVVKADASGNIVWQKSFGGNNEDLANAIQQTSDGGYIMAGKTTSMNNGDVSGNMGNADYWVVKMDTAGILEWQKCLGGSYIDEAKSIEQTSDGGYIVLGTSESNDGQVTGSYGGTDYWMVKLDSAGTITWQKSYGEWDYEEAYYVKQTPDGGYIISGDTYSYSLPGHHGQTDIWILKTDASGNIEWQKMLGGSELDFAYQVQIANDGGYIVSGGSYSENGDVSTNNGNTDYWIVKLDDTGTLLWQKSYGGNNYDDAYSVKPTEDGGYIVAGGASSDNFDVLGNNGTWDMWVMKLTENFSTIKGNIFIDLNSNGIQDAGEQPVQQHQVFETTTGNSNFSGANGRYYVFVGDTGNFTVIPSGNINYFAPSPSSHSAHFTAMNQTDSLNHFPFQPTGVYNDLCVAISPVTPFRAGFNASYEITYNNYGTTVLNPIVIFYPDSGVNFISSSPTPSSITQDSIIWNLGPLSPFQSGTIAVEVNLDTTLIMGSMINSYAVVEPITGDFNPSCNTSYWETEITGSYDPNDILVNRKSLYTNEFPNPPFLDYLIRFQNTGTDTAFTVRVFNVIDTSKVTAGSFEFVSSSHVMSTSYHESSSEFEFLFENILLPDSNINASASNGYIRYRIKPKSNLIINDSIQSSAAIYFDFNSPVITNIAITEIVDPTSIQNISEGNSYIQAFPNPAFQNLTIHIAGFKNQHVNIDIVNAFGQIVKSFNNELINEENYFILTSLEKIANGIYFINLKTDSGNQIYRFVKL